MKTTDQRIHLLRWTVDDMTFEDKYHVLGKRLFPWPGVPDPAFGGAWVVVRPRDSSAADQHDECEMYFIVEGDGILEIDGETKQVGPGDTIFIAPFQRHRLTNPHDIRLLYLDLWWGGGAQPAEQPPSQGA